MFDNQGLSASLAPQCDLTASEAARDRFRAGAQKVLLLEQNNWVRYRLSTFLKKAGYQVCEADDAASAIRIVQLSDKFDLILADVDKPRSHGIDVVMSIRSLLGEKGLIPVIALASENTHEGRDRLLNAGFTDFHIKSNSSDSLQALLSRLSSDPTLAATSQENAYHDEVSHA